jgi:SHS2 domain-containing protein
MNEVWYLVDGNNFVFNTFDSRSEAVAEYKKFWKNGYDVEVHDFQQRCEALAAQRARSERALRKIKEAVEKEQAQ